MTDQCAVITHHEAGHAVAVLMTVNNELDDQKAVTVTLIVDGPGGGNNLLRPPSGNYPGQAAFIYYAGPWAEARVGWDRPVHSLDDTDDDGRLFGHVVAETFRYGPGSDGEGCRALAQVDPSIPDKEPQWSVHLENAWPVIETLADALRDRLNDAESVPYIPELGGDRVMKSASMTHGEVVRLVQPLLEACEMWRYLS